MAYTTRMHADTGCISRMGDLHAPQILIGASNSKRFGCDMQISFAIKQIARISFSAS